MSKPAICFLGGTRLSQPLADDQAKKYRELSRIGEIFVVGFSSDARPRCFTRYARFYLLPKLSPAFLRHGLMFLVVPFVLGFLVLRYPVRILVAQSPYEGSVAAFVKLAARLFRKKMALVIESHGNFETTLFLQRRVRLAPLQRFLMQISSRFALAHADVLRAVSGSTREQLETQAPGRPVVEFPTWTDIDVFLDAGAHRSEQGKPVVLYAGVLTSLKGVHLLVRVFERLAPDFADAELLIVGAFEDPSYLERLKSDASAGLESGRISFLGRVPRAELANHMARARVLVLPSASEGLPRVVFEAMACGTPVIGTAVGGIPDLIQDGVNGFLFDFEDTEMLERRIRWLLEHPEECRRMGSAACSFARRVFSTQHYREGYERLVEIAAAVVDEGV